MYRNRAGRLSFSFQGLLANSFPFFATEGRNDIELTSLQKDLLFVYQITEPDPKQLGPLAFSHAKICDNEKVSRQVHRDLQKNGCIDSAGHVDTTKITSKFTHQLARISVHAQRKLVTLLFLWEEETTRLKLLEQEAAELKQLRDQAVDEGTRQNLDVVLRQLEADRRLRPSQRNEAGIRMVTGENDDLPPYSLVHSNTV